jgi:hypothetical protein
MDWGLKRENKEIVMKMDFLWSINRAEGECCGGT